MSRTYRRLSALALTISALASSPLIQAEATSATLGVTILMKSFSGPEYSDQRCIQSAAMRANNATVRFNCPRYIEMSTQVNRQAGWTVQSQHLQAGDYQLSQHLLARPGGGAQEPGAPIEITLSW